MAKESSWLCFKLKLAVNIKGNYKLKALEKTLRHASFNTFLSAVGASQHVSRDDDRPRLYTFILKYNNSADALCIGAT